MAVGGYFHSLSRWSFSSKPLGLDLKDNLMLASATRFSKQCHQLDRNSTSGWPESLTPSEACRYGDGVFCPQRSKLSDWLLLPATQTQIVYPGLLSFLLALTVFVSALCSSHSLCSGTWRTQSIDGTQCPSWGTGIHDLSQRPSMLPPSDDGRLLHRSAWFSQSTQRIPSTVLISINSYPDSGDQHWQLTASTLIIHLSSRHGSSVARLCTMTISWSFCFLPHDFNPCEPRFTRLD